MIHLPALPGSPRAEPLDRTLARVADLAERALADAIIVTGSGTGAAVDVEELARVRAAVSVPVLVGSGATPESAKALLRHASGIIVGSASREGGRAITLPGRGDLL